MEEKTFLIFYNKKTNDFLGYFSSTNSKLKKSINNARVFDDVIFGMNSLLHAIFDTDNWEYKGLRGDFSLLKKENIGYKFVNCKTEIRKHKINNLYKCIEEKN